MTVPQIRRASYRRRNVEGGRATGKQLGDPAIGPRAVTAAKISLRSNHRVLNVIVIPAAIVRRTAKRSRADWRPTGRIDDGAGKGERKVVVVRAIATERGVAIGAASDRVTVHRSASMGAAISRGSNNVSGKRDCRRAVRIVTIATAAEAMNDGGGALRRDEGQRAKSVRAAPIGGDIVSGRWKLNRVGDNATIRVRPIVASAREAVEHLEADFGLRGGGGHCAHNECCAYEPNRFHLCAPSL